MIVIRRTLWCLLGCVLFGTACAGGDADGQMSFSTSQRFAFPDFPPGTGNTQTHSEFVEIREAMKQASSSGNTLTQAEEADLRERLTRLASGDSEDPVTPYAQRRLIILDWQTGKATGLEAADRLRELAAGQETADRAFSEATALTIELRDRHIERFIEGYPSLSPPEVPQFASFAFIYERELLAGYVAKGVTSNQTSFSTPVPDELQRKQDVVDFLEKKYLPSLEGYLKQYQQKLEQASADSPLRTSPETQLERENFVGAVRELARYIHRNLGGRGHLEISERATDVLLPRTLELWETALGLQIHEPDFPKVSAAQRDEIATYRTSIIPHLKDLQAARYAASTSTSAHPATGKPFWTRGRILIFSLMVGCVLFVLLISWIRERMA